LQQQDNTVKTQWPEKWYVLFPLSLIFSLLMIYHYIIPLGALPFTAGIKGQDSGQMIWNIWFANEAITHGQNPYHTDLLFYPIGANLAHHTLAPGFFPVTLLVKTIVRGDRLYPFYAYQVIILLSFTLLLCLSYLLLRELGFPLLPSATAAVAFAFSDFFYLHLLHINHLASFFFPLTALFLVRSFRRPASLNVIAAAFVAAVSVYFTEFAIYIYMAAALMAVMIFLFKRERTTLLSGVREAGGKRLAMAGATFALIISPFLFVLFKDVIRKPGYVEISHYSANVVGFFVPGQEREEAEVFGTPYMTPLYGTLFHTLDEKITAGVGGFEIFVGFPSLIFTLFALIKSRNRWIRMCLAAALFFFILSLGPTLKVFAVDTGWKLPYALLMKLPPFDAGRTPVRFVAMGLFFLMIVSASGMSTLAALFRNRAGQRWAAITMGIVFVWTVAEVYSPAETRRPFRTPAALSNIAVGPVMNLPPVQWDGYAAMLQTQHHQPLATGYLARNNDAQWDYSADQFYAFSRGGAYFCSYLQQLGFRNVVIAPARMTAPNPFDMRPLELDKCQVTTVDLRGEAASSPDKLDPNSAVAEQRTEYPLLSWGKMIEFGSEEADQYLGPGWSGREQFSHWTDRGEAAFGFALAEVRGGRLVMKMGPFLAPPKLTSQRVVIKLNGHPIANLTITEQDPREYSIPFAADTVSQQNILTFALPDAEIPRRIGVSPDTRLLGINVQWLAIY